MALQPASLSVTSIDGVACIQLLGEVVVDEQTIDELERQAIRIVDAASPPKLLISFKGVNYVASALLGKMISLSHRLATKHARLHVSDMNQHIRSVCEVTRIGEMFEQHESQAAAIKAMNEEVAAKPDGE